MINGYDELQLAKKWLCMSNDLFYKTYGFSWVPSLKIREIAMEELKKEGKK